MRHYRTVAILACSILLFLAGIVVWEKQTRYIPIFSDREMLEGLWHHYKKEFLEQGTSRTLDPERGDITTSEGQSYTMLRAVWMDDQETFDISWQWTKDNLQREDDYLFSWLFGRRQDGTFGVLDTPGAEHSASDADVDIALSLLLAYARWRKDSYYYDAIPIIEDIWEHNVVYVAGIPYLAANNIEKTSSSATVLLNPSYFAPFAYRIFAVVDKAHPWEMLVDSSYAVIEESISLPLGGTTPGVLPPDWVVINRINGELSASTNTLLSTNYGFDALRTPWRIALDYKWSRDPRAKETLELFSFLQDEWKAHGRLSSTYSHHGEPLNAGEESLAMYGGAIGYLSVIDPKSANDLYQKKLVGEYDPAIFTWKNPMPYYATNIGWFGIALYRDFLADYTGIALETSETQ
jgi:endoglucanase